MTQLKLDMYTGATLGDFVDDVASAVTAPDDRTARIQFSNPVNEEIVLSLLQPTRFAAKESVYGKHVKSIENADSEEAKSDAIAELQERTIAQPIGSGPFQWEDADSQRTLVTKFDGHPDAGKINFPRAEFKYLPENQARWNALINDQTDGSATLFMPQNQVRRLPDHVRMGMIPRPGVSVSSTTSETSTWASGPSGRRSPTSSTARPSRRTPGRAPARRSR